MEMLEVMEGQKVSRRVLRTVYLKLDALNGYYHAQQRPFRFVAFWWTRNPYVDAGSHLVATGSVLFGGGALSTGAGAVSVGKALNLTQNEFRLMHKDYNGQSSITDRIWHASEYHKKKGFSLNGFNFITNSVFAIIEELQEGSSSCECD